MTRTVWVVMALIVLALGIGAIVRGNPHKTRPHQELARAVIIPNEREHLVIVPPCGTGVNVASFKPASLAKTPGSIVFRLPKRGPLGDRVVIVPRCRAAQGAEQSEGVNVPSAAFVLPIGANLTAGRAGSAEAGTEQVQSQLVIPADSPIDTVVVPRCIESLAQGEKTATGRAIVLDPARGQPNAALGPPC